MYAVSDRFLTALRHSHTIATRLDVTRPDGTVLETVDATGGEVTVDTRRSVRRECSFAIPATARALIPAAAGDLLSPLSGNELRPYRGIDYGDGTSELVPLGVFPIRSSPPSLGEDGVVTVTVGGQDRSSTVTRNRWERVFVIAAGTSLEDAIAAVLADRAPMYPVNFRRTGITVPATTFGLEVDNDPWSDARSLATAAGYDLFYDVTGTAVLVQPADPVTAAPVIAYANDTEAVITSASKVWDAENAFNGCIAIGEGTGVGTPVRAEVWDDDPASPTYRLGAYGRYPEFIVSPLITNAGQAQAAATAQFARRRGVGQSVSWRQLVNAAHEGGDPVAFTQTRLRITSPLTVVLDAFTVPWTAEATMNAEARGRQLDGGAFDIDEVYEPEVVPDPVGGGSSGLYGEGVYGEGLYG